MSAMKTKPRYVLMCSSCDRQCKTVSSRTKGECPKGRRCKRPVVSVPTLKTIEVLTDSLRDLSIVRNDIDPSARTVQWVVDSPQGEWVSLGGGGFMRKGARNRLDD